MAALHTLSASHRVRRFIDLGAAVLELLRHEEDEDPAHDADEVCRMIELNGMIGFDPELATLD